MRRTDVLAAQVVLALFAIGCGDAADEDSADAFVLPLLELEVDSEGGVFDGTRETIFEGLRLEVPKGALSGRTRIEIAPTGSVVPLPNLGESCGETFRVQAHDAELRAPLRLTLPVDTDALAATGERIDDVRVWRFVGGEASQVVAQERSERTVTVPIDSFGAFAPGVIRQLATRALCQVLAGEAECAGVTTSEPFSGAIGSGAPAAACDTEFCVSPLTQPEAFANAGFNSLVVSNDKLYYSAFTSDTDFRAFEVNLSTGATRRSEPFVPISIRDAAVDNAGGYWLGRSSGGNVQIAFGGTAPRAFDVGTNISGRAGVTLADGTFVRATEQQGFVRRSNASSFVGPTIFEGTGRLVAVAGESLFWNNARPNGTVLELKRVEGTDIFTESETLLTLTEQIIPGRLVDLSTPGHRRALIGNNRWRIVEPGVGVEELGLQTSCALTTAGRRATWMCAGSAEVLLVENIADAANRALTVIRLVSTDPASLESSASVPLHLFELSGNRVLVVTLGRELLVIRPNATRAARLSR